MKTAPFVTILALERLGLVMQIGLDHSHPLSYFLRKYHAPFCFSIARDCTTMNSWPGLKSYQAYVKYLF